MDIDTEPVEGRSRAPYHPPTDKPKTFVVSWRLNAEENAFWQAFFASFPERQKASAVRWLVSQPQVREVMLAKMREGLVQ